MLLYAHQSERIIFWNINEGINSRDSENCSAGLTRTLCLNPILRAFFFFTKYCPLWDKVLPYYQRDHHLFPLLLPLPVTSHSERHQQPCQALIQQCKCYMPGIRAKSTLSHFKHFVKGSLALHWMHSGETFQVEFWASWPQWKPQLDSGSLNLHRRCLGFDKQAMKLISYSSCMLVRTFQGKRSISNHLHCSWLHCAN